MKIVFVVSAINGGGAERVIVTMANRYAVCGDDVTILMVAGHSIFYNLNENIRVLSIGQPSGGNPLVQIKRLFSMRKYFRMYRDSFIVAFSTRINMFSILASIGLKNSLVVSERNDPNQFHYIWLRDKIYELGARGNTRFVFQTEEAMKCFPERIQRKSTVIPNPLRADLPEPFLGKREKKIAAVGRLESQKNHKLLIDAFLQFHQKFPEYILHIFGQGSLEQELKIQVHRLKLDEVIHFEGFCNNILERIRNFGMFVLSSDYEGISNSLVEAMSLGIPSISTDCPIGGSALCIRDEQNGLLVPVGDVEALAEAMIKIAEDKQMAEHLSIEAIKIRETFGEKIVTNKWREYIEGGNGAKE